MNNEQIKILALEAQNGSQMAFEILLQKFCPIIKGYLKLYYAPGEDRDDFLQESYIAIWEAVVNYCPEKKVPFTAFAKIIVERKVKSFLRTRKRLKHVPLNEALSLSHNLSQFENEKKLEDIIADDKLNPERIIFNKEQSEETKIKFNNFISEKITPLEKSVLENYIKNKSYQEIANSIGYSYKTVDNALSRIRRKAEVFFKQAANSKVSLKNTGTKKKDYIIGMSELEKAVFLEYLKGKRYYQIAGQLKISNKSVSNALSRVKQKIRSKEDVGHDLARLTS